MLVKEVAKTICDRVASLHHDIYGVKILDNEATETHSRYADQPNKASLAKVWENEKLVIVWGLISSFDRIQSGLESFRFTGKDASVLCVPAMENLVVVIMSPTIPSEGVDEILAVIQTEIERAK